MWLAVLVGSVGCYLTKLLGLSMPRRVLDDPRVRRAAELLPVALLAALIVTQTFTTGRHVGIDARGAGVAAGALAVLARAPFLVVIAVACAVAAGVRMLA